MQTWSGQCDSCGKYQPVNRTDAPAAVLEAERRQVKSSWPLVVLVILASVVLTPLVGLIAGAFTYSRSRSDALWMIAGGIVAWGVAVFVVVAAR